MLELLQFYVSGFWVWAGITIGMSVVATGIGNVFVTLIAMVKR